ncbi:acetyl-CoA carboxylase biotin carboxyl carrier protein [Enorma burkinafasonensis]|uniref:acetyl-CoA carboxylase biotin carboxyl carrier protein n=1 Tax=Enorma burkinafasonensis TaxID=2590867 RepID=UPI0011A31698|nr:acetyl-CoA carboxylase biotin carboxyl carrier protein [Enorma burkinafasonensis]
MKIDSQKLNEVAALMEDHGLTRVRLSEEDGRVIELERMAPVPPAPAATIVAPLPLAEAASASAAGTPEAAAPVHERPVAEAPADGGAAATATAVPVTAPMVGVFYAAPSPEAEPFVTLGSHVKRGDTLCIIEAMKLMNEVVAEADGTVVAIDAADGDLVEFGARIMAIEPDAVGGEA